MRRRDITDPQDMPLLQRELDAVVRDGTQAKCDKRFVYSEGTQLRTQDRISVIRGGNGRTLPMLPFEFAIA